ncbi:type VII secretion-associated protein [Corynebacterium sp. sy017]|uniref:type VII secretion-associated protein n=1 Tax=unclassified Corynebacterium TaxID=2624378 RepID=UPI001185CA82|nr:MULTISPECIES: type VII secretion-associated protein [unclassified Corynebacterium]MBP3088651.1 type VII secretion-associated protein [Corynebacterium sp. sy017]TSD91943.1 type VII secretion-associated protein [Corynebacterium sp. SY003]
MATYPANTYDLIEPEEMTPDLIISVIDTATIFERSGADSVYRYDLPASGVTLGWALEAIADQARTMLAAIWSDAEIAVDATAEVAEHLVGYFVERGINAYAAEVIREQELPDTAQSYEEIQRPRKSVQRNIFSWVNPLRLAIIFVVVMVIILSWITLGKETKENTHNSVYEAQAQEDATEQRSGSRISEETKERAKHSKNQEKQQDSGQVVLESEVLLVSLPMGFHWEEKMESGQVDTNQILTATGQDKDLRILLSIEPMHDLSPQQIIDEMRTTIDLDPTLSHTAPLETKRGKEHIGYRESPGDGSTVQWSVWVENASIYSVGCHVRAQETLNISQRATCRMAIESVAPRNA